MREEILGFLRCPACANHSLVLDKGVIDKIEIRSGRINCRDCGAEYKIEGGIIDFLNNAKDNVLRERKAMDDDEYITDEKGNKYRINAETIQRFKEKFLSLPEGDGSYFFKSGGSFQTTAEASGRFYSAMDNLHLKGGERILEIGACFSYASSKFAKKGCSVVALDISNYLKVADLYIQEAYFERMFSDMHYMPFMDNAFDIVFGSAILHHSKNLKDVFSEIRRILAPGGRLVLINEAARGAWEKVHPVFKKMEEKGFGDTSYTVPQFEKAAQGAGLKKVRISYSSLADDYIVKHKNRGSRHTFKISLAYFFSRHRRIENFIGFFLIVQRCLFRPRSWKLTAFK